MTFDVPNYGRVEHTNAVFVHFLERLTRTTIENRADRDMKLEDIPVGGTAIATFRASGQVTTVEIRRIS